MKVTQLRRLGPPSLFRRCWAFPWRKRLKRVTGSEKNVLFHVRLSPGIIAGLDVVGAASREDHVVLPNIYFMKWDVWDV
jgi:hypothetical protein